MQQIDLLKDFPARRWALIFILAHLFFWTAVPALVRYNLPLDAIEGTLWGQQMQWGYDKNPFMNAWLTELAVTLGGRSEWIIYFFSQLSVAICFMCVWLLAKKMLPAVYALIAVMVLEGVQYYHLHAIDFNDNTLELSTWALTIYFFYLALRTRTLRSWLLTGVFAALAMMVKYYTAVLLAAMALFLFADKNNRAVLRTAPPYIGWLVFLAIILPHVLWLFKHEFITITYVFQRAGSVPSWTNHFFSCAICLAGGDYVFADGVFVLFVCSLD